MKKIKGKSKLLYIFVLILVAMFASVGTVFAERIIASNKVTYSNGTSGLSSTNVQSAIDELYRKCIRNGGCGATFARALQASEASDTVMVDDGTADHNMRFMGMSPNNYVTFNGELWRVIGVFNNVDNGTGKKETRAKIIRASSFGNKAWDNNNVNIWKNSTLNSEFQASSYATNSMVENAVWHLGDPGGIYAYTASRTYEIERETTVASGNDPTWTGKVGLMYPSDYGFASSTCKDSKLYAFHVNTSCAANDWLYLGSNEWLLPPIYNDYAARAILLGYPGSVGNGSLSATYITRPTVYLKSNVTCKNCNEATAGTKENPFQIG